MRGFGIFLACLALGVAVIAGIGSLTEALQAGLAREARTILGGDVELAQFSRPLPPDAEDWLAAEAQAVSHIVTMRGMAHSEDGTRRSLIELKAVDGAYPLTGTLELEGGADLPAALADGGVAADRGLFERLGLEIGDRIRIGGALLVLRAVITREPDRLTAGIALGPRVMVNHASLERTGLVRPGTMSRHRYRALLPPGVTPEAWSDALEHAFPDGGWRLRDSRNANPSLERQLDRVGSFLTLTGLAALLIGGIGVASAVSNHLEGKLRTIATLKCVGATQAVVLLAYLIQIAILGLAAIGVGLALGAALPPVLASLAGGALPLPLSGTLHAAPLAFAAACGALTVLTFSLWPLGRAARTRPGLLFRSAVDPSSGRPPLAAVAGTVLAAGGLAALVVATAPLPEVALWFAAGVPVSLALFRGAAAVVVLAARRTRPRRGLALRLGLANLSRTGAPTVPVALSLGTGLAVLIALVLVQSSLGARLVERSADRPAFFFVDIQPGQAEAFDRLVSETEGAERDARMPMLRGRIIRIAGKPVSETDVAPGSEWAVRSDIGLSYAATPPANAAIVEGRWWNEDYRGPALLSLGAEIARDFGVGIGDTLTLNVLGREVTAQIASLREVDWTALEINFIAIFSPGVLDGAPQIHLATVRATPEAEPVLERRVTERFANISAIPIRAVVAALDEMLGRVAGAVQAVAAVTVGTGLLVMAGAIAAGRERRVRDAVVMKVLGARRADLTRAFLVEHLLLGCIAAGLAFGIGTLAAWGFTTGVLGVELRFRVEYVIAMAAACITITLILGFASTWRALGRKAAPLLRME